MRSNGGVVIRQLVRSHLGPVVRPGTGTVWWWLCLVPAIVAWIVAWSMEAPTTALIAAGPAVWVVLAFVVVGELRPVVASNRADADCISFATLFAFVVLLRWGLPLALVAVLVSVVVGDVMRRKRAYIVVYNVAQCSLAYVVSWGVLRAGGWEATAADPAVLALGDLGILALAAAGYHLTNLALFAVARWLDEGRSWWAWFTDDLAWHTAVTGALLAISPVVLVLLEASIGFVLLLAIPMTLFSTTARYARDRERRSLTDPLTGLANREALDGFVEQRLRDVAERGTRIALCVLDLDRFKEVNDTLGHDTGDELLRSVATRLAAGVRVDDAVARIGGDEFVVLMRVSGEGEAAVAIERLAEELHQPIEIGGVRLEVEISVGYAMLGVDGDDLRTLLRRADVAMYAAKAAGEIARRFSSDLDRHQPRRLQLLADLRRALRERELELHYQPQVTVPDGEVVGVEALVRWRHPELGLLPPDEFLPLVERTATMRLVTAVVLELALEQCATWRAAGLTVPVAINASLHDVADAGFVERIMAGLDRHGLEPSDLRVEITEQALAGDTGSVIRVLEALAAAGIELALDDFGTGHASLTRLARLPVSEVKLDRTFVDDLVHGAPQVVAIVRSIIELTRAVGARSLAEGVATGEQWSSLVELGCEGVQGWLVAPAMPAEEATAWLRAHAQRPVSLPVGPDGVGVRDR